jgi:hypothetical protein
MSCCTSNNNESISILNKTREAAVCAQTNCASAEESAEAAALSAYAAAVSAGQAAASAALSGIYLGPKATAPTTDNEGNPLQEGMQYFNTTDSVLYIWNGTAWQSSAFNEFTNFTATGSLSSENLVNRFEDIDKVKDFPSYSFLATGTTTPRDLVTRMADVVNVKDFGAVGDGIADDTSAFQAAATVGGKIIVPQSNYKIIGEVIFGSNTTLQVDNGTVFTMDCSGENGRGFYFEEAINSGIRGDFIINASATSLGTDGSKNSCIQFGNASNAASPTITQFCFATGSIEINISGSQDVKAIYLNGWVEDTILDGVIITGQTNYAITAHWSSNTFPALPTKTWHSHNITIRNCKVYQKFGFSKPLRGLTFSASGRVLVNNCYMDCQTLGYNLFVGDYGYTYAQNISEDEAYDFSIANCYQTGEGGFSADAVSAGVNGSPIWNGYDHKASILVDGFEANANNHSTGLIFGITGIDVGSFNSIKLYSDNVTHTREFFYPQLCNSIQLTNSTFKHQRYARFSTTGYVNLDGCHISKPSPTPDATSYAITIEGVRFSNIVNSSIKDSRTGIYSVDNFDKAIRVIGNTFENIGLACIDVNYCSKLTISNNTFKNVGTTTTTVNINLLNFDVNVTGFIVSGNLFSTNDARYIVYLSNSASNGVITGNAFLDLNTAATNSAAVFLDGSATNVLIDTGTNVVGSGINLIHP